MTAAREFRPPHPSGRYAGTPYCVPPLLMVSDDPERKQAVAEAAKSTSRAHGVVPARGLPEHTDAQD
ncbi:hypothetical protein ACFVWG_25710 [Kribbella sp. NPDC058245]|uniref:hypothetical protein n=1 Tax=Kribbella sp. NPDC058245 TaxID=3346399 RepID=UPI0036F00F95